MTQKLCWRMALVGQIPLDRSEELKAQLVERVQEALAGIDGVTVDASIFQAGVDGERYVIPAK